LTGRRRRGYSAGGKRTRRRPGRHAYRRDQSVPTRARLRALSRQPLFGRSPNRTAAFTSATPTLTAATAARTGNGSSTAGCAVLPCRRHGGAAGI